MPHNVNKNSYATSIVNPIKNLRISRNIFAEAFYKLFLMLGIYFL